MPAFAHDAVDVLEERREGFEVGVGRLLHRDVLAVERRGEALAPLAVTWVRAEEKLRTLARRRLARHQATSRSTKRPSYGAFVGVFPATRTTRRDGSSPSRREQRLVLRTRSPRWNMSLWGHPVTTIASAAIAVVTRRGRRA